MTDRTWSSTLQTAWERQRVWSQMANALKRQISRWRQAILLISVVGAAFVTAGAQVSGTWSGLGRGLALSGAVILAVAPVIRARQLSKDKVENWGRARSVSEALKTEVFLYQTASEPYGDHATRDVHLRERTSEILDSVADLEVIAAGVQPDDKQPPPSMDLDDYITLRVDSQIEGYYLRKAGETARRLRRFRGLEFVLALLAVAIGVVVTFADSESARADVGAWVAVVTTAGTAVAAHIAANRFEHVVTSYMRTASRLRNIRDAWRDAQPESRMSPSDFVHKCEEAISVENQAWMAKLAEQPKEPT